jgi:hypothetical protein
VSGAGFTHAQCPGEEIADAERDVLGLLGAALTGDGEAIRAAEVASRHMKAGALTVAALGFLVEVLVGHEADPVAWVAAKQAELLGQAAGRG